MQETIYRFGEFVLNRSERILRRQGVLVPLPPKAIAALLVLLEADGRVVSKAELLDAVWPGTFVDEANLPQTISVLRKGLEQGFPDSTPIETIARVGYMFRAPVSVSQLFAGAANKQQDVTGPQSVSGQPVPEAYDSVSPATPARSGLRSKWLAFAGVMTAIGLALVLRSTFLERPFFSENHKLVPLTTGAAWEVDPAISPDGKLLAYSSRPEGDATYSLWVKPVFGTEGAKCMLRDANNLVHPAWSPDGKQIAYLAVGLHDPVGIFLLDLPTGATRLLKPLPIWGFHVQTPLSIPKYPGPAWIPDGRSILYAEWNGRDRTSLQLLNLDSGKTEPLIEAPELTADGDPTVSPDGRSVAFLRSSYQTTDIDVVDLKTRKMTTVQARWGSMSGLAWDPNGKELLTASDHAGLGWSLWRVPLRGDPKPVAAGTSGKAYEPVFSRDGKVMAFTVWDDSTDLQLVPDLWGKETARVLYPATQGVTATDISQDGRQIAFLSDRSGQFEVWLAPVEGSDGAQPVQLTHGLNVQDANSIAWSPDGRTLALAVRDPQDRCELVDTHTGRTAPLQLPGAEKYGCTVPMFSEDGRWIYAYVENERGLATYKVSASAVPYAEEMKGVLSDALFFENDPWQYSLGPRKVGLFRSKIGEAELKLEPIPGLENVEFASSWITQEGGILFLDRRKANPALQRYDVKSGAIVDLTAPLKGVFYDRDFAYRSREHFLVYTRYREGAGTQIYAITSGTR